jgi:hypothetical protein
MSIYLKTNSDGYGTEGIGAVVQYQLLLHAICKKLGVGFYSSPFKNIAHSSYNNCENQKWSSSFTNFFNFPIKDDSEYNFLFSKIDDEFFSFIENYKDTSSSILVYLEPECILEYGQLIVDEIYKKKYLIDVKKNFIFNDNYFSDDKLNISLHIRCINPEDNSLQDFRELYNKNNLKYINLIKFIKKICIGQKVDFHIHSQGDEKNFIEFLEYQEKDFQFKLHINDHPISDIYHMSHADLLIMANSSFSWISHLMNYNTSLVRDNFWHITYPNTIKLDSNYSFIDKKLKLK